MNVTVRPRVLAPPDSPVLAGIGHVAPSWLERRLRLATTRVLDVRSEPLSAHDESGPRLRRISRRAGLPFLDGHVPGSVALDVRVLFDDRGDVVSAPELAMAMSGLGVGDEHTVVLVDEGRSDAALAAAWALKRFGHADVYVLDGGFARWIGEGRPVSREVVRHPPASYTAKVPS